MAIVQKSVSLNGNTYYLTYSSSGYVITDSVHNYVKALDSTQKVYTETNITANKLQSDIEVDSALSSSSENPVQNKVVTTALEGKADSNHAHAGYCPATHTHASDDITALTSYSKPSSTSAITTSDTLNSALGKLEKAVEGKEASSNKVTTITSTATDAQYPSALATYNAINGKQATITGGATTITSSNLTTNRALIANGSGKVAVSSVTSTELTYLSGVTSSIQTQLSGKELSSNKVTTLSVSSTDTQYPSAKCVYDALQNVDIDVDSELSSTSENPVQNKIINSALNNKADANHVHSGYQTTGNLVTSISASSTDATYPSAKCVYDSISDKVSTSRTINNKALTSNITLSASDVGAASSDHVHSGYASTSHTHSGYASTSHTHVGSEVTLTGYTKAGSVSAVTTSDTVNQAIGKVEKALDAMPSKLSDLDIDLTLGSKETENTTTILTSGTIALSDTISIYKHTPNANTTYAISTTGITFETNKIFVFDLCIAMDTVVSISFPSEVVWSNNTTPDLSTSGIYIIRLKTFNGGEKWFATLEGKFNGVANANLFAWSSSDRTVYTSSRTPSSGDDLMDNEGNVLSGYTLNSYNSSTNALDITEPSS